MQIPTLILLQFLGLAAALPPPPPGPVGPNPLPKSATDSNPYDGRVQYVNPTYAAKLEQTVSTFLSAGDKLNAARTKTVQNTSTFVWVTTVAGLSNIDDAIAQARKVQKKTKKPQLVNLVLYDLPSRDCSAGESAGEFQVDNNGLELYKTKFIDPYAKKLRDAKDLTFSVVIEPDSLGNLVTNLGIEQCANVAPTYVEGIAYAIASLQEPNVALYIDAAHGGWLGWADNLPLAANVFAKVVNRAKEIKKSSKIRGFSTNVSNFNPYIANPRANYTEWSPSYDEKHYAESLTPFLKNQSLPANFIIDQGRAGLQNQRAEWGDWCNVKAGFGDIPTAVTNSSVVDALVWIKPAGESDGRCGPNVNGTAAPAAGVWWNEYAAQSVIYANPPLKPTW